MPHTAPMGWRPCKYKSLRSSQDSLPFLGATRKTANSQTSSRPGRDPESLTMLEAHANLGVSQYLRTAANLQAGRQAGRHSLSSVLCEDGVITLHSAVTRSSTDQCLCQSALV